MRITWHSPEELFDAAKRTLVCGDTLLDIGCGIRPQNLVAPRVHICCEPFPPYAARLLRAGAGAHVVLQASWAQAIHLFPPKSVDSVFLLDVIEHLEKEEGQALLRATEPVARKQMVVFTPLGFLPQERLGRQDAWGLDGEVVQEHKSGWWPSDFDDGWDVLAARNFHTHDQMKRPFPEPFGAFFAVKTFTDQRDDERDRRTRSLRRLAGAAASITDVRVLESILEMVESAAKIHQHWMLAPPNAILGAELQLRDSWLGRSLHQLAMKLGVLRRSDRHDVGIQDALTLQGHRTRAATLFGNWAGRHRRR